MKVGICFEEFDAELNTDCCDRYNNAELTITLRLGFSQKNPAGGAAEGTLHNFGDPSDPDPPKKIVKWDAGSWNKWKKEFVQSAQKFWHGKFWLVSNFPNYDYEDRGVKYRPNIWCRFKLEGGDAASGIYHHKIDVVRLHPSENWFGSHSTLYDSLDLRAVKKGEDSKGHPLMQRAHVHEVGHLLGLAHVDVGKAHCPTTSDTNLKPCYGLADHDRKSVMGSGMELRVEHAGPWRRAIKNISGKGNVGGLTDWAPKMVRHYPRTLKECLGNAALTRRPHRG